MVNVSRLFLACNGRENIVMSSLKAGQIIFEMACLSFEAKTLEFLGKKLEFWENFTMFYLIKVPIH